MRSQGAHPPNKGNKREMDKLEVHAQNPLQTNKQTTQHSTKNWNKKRREKQQQQLESYNIQLFSGHRLTEKHWVLMEQVLTSQLWELPSCEIEIN